MKLVFAVVRVEDTKNAVKELNKKEFGVTKLSSSGGFLRKDNCTLMIGTDDDHISNYTYTPIKVEAGGAIVFVVDVAQFYKI